MIGLLGQVVANEILKVVAGETRGKDIAFTVDDKGKGDGINSKLLGNLAVALQLRNMSPGGTCLLDLQNGYPEPTLQADSIR